MEHIEYQNTIDAIKILTNLFDIILYKERDKVSVLDEFKSVTEEKLKELIGKL
jgi:hypothetical protein